MALRQILLKITGDPSDAKRALQETAEDLRKLDGQEAEARVSIKSEAIKAQIEIVKARLERLSAQEATPKVQIQMGRAVEQIDRLEEKLRRLDGKDVDIDLRVRGGGEEVLGALSRAGTALAGAGAAVGVGGLASVIQGLGAALVVVVPLLVSLASAMAAAAAGAGALGVALAGALGPAALVGVVALTRFAAILKAVQERQKGTADTARQQSSSAAQIAAAQDQLASATDGVARAQDNLRDQTTAAYRAWQDAIQAVKQDLLDVEHAQVGIDDANLRLREAQQALKDFQAQAGTAGNAFSAIFAKFTDVAVDTSGLRGAITAAASASGTNLSGGDELKLERLILNVREAKLGEKDASEKLHTANTQLTRDRATEADFAQRGIRAYAPYAAAVAATTQAHRSLIAAQRNLTQAQTAAVAATAKQSQEYDKLSRSERRVADSLLRIADAVSKAFGPAVASIFDGFVSSLERLTRLLQAAPVAALLQNIGRAIGSVFRSLGRTATSPEVLLGFAQLATAGARLIRVFGNRIFNDLLLILLRIAVAALPQLEQGAARLADQFDKWEKGTRNAEAVRAKVHELVEEFFAFVKGAQEVVKATVTVARFINGMAEVFTTAFARIADFVGFFVGIARSRTFQVLALAIGTFVVAVTGVGEVAAGVFAFVRGLSLMVRLVGGLAVLGAIPARFFDVITGGARSATRALQRFAHDAGDLASRAVAGVRSAVSGLPGVFSSVLGRVGRALSGFADTARGFGRKIGEGLVSGIRGALRGLTSIGRFIANGLIDALNFAIHAINHGLPDKLNLPGLPDINLPDNPIPEIPKLANGGLIVSRVLAELGERAGQQEAVLPLTHGVFRQMGQGILSAAPMLAPAFAGGGRAGTHIDNFHANINAPAGELPDVRHTATALTRLMERSGAGGDVGQE